VFPGPELPGQRGITTASSHTIIQETRPMLVLSRRESERIRLGENIVVTVIRVSGDRVRLGIDAPRDVVILRDELEPRPQSPLALPPSNA